MNSVSGLNLFRLLSFIVLLFAAQSTSYSQQTEADVKVQADKLFEEEKYVDATPLYSSLLALNPRSHDYNYRFGTCLLYNSYKKQDAFKYLNYAVTDAGTDIQAYYFLGKAYHLNYQFNEAIKNYELYKQKAAGKPKAGFEVDRQIEMCQNGKRLLTTISDLVVLQKTESNAKDFFRLYKLPEHIGGDIIVAADFQSKIDKKKGHIPLVHLPAQSNSTIYYASYGDNDTGQKDIYMRRKLPDGSWSLPQVIAGSVNTKSDEDFPFMQAGSNYLYFSSKGHNSMGGYDIFRSKLDVENNTFGAPENMDFAISSPDNDLFFVVDSLDNNAYFASTRQSSNGNIHVYKVRVTRVPLQLAVIKGNFSSTIRPENKKISVTVTDYASGEKIGTFTSNEKGSYLITFPKGGKYTYEMKVEGSTLSHKYLVSIPFTKEFKPLKQKILEETLDNSEVVRVVDLFNEEVEDPAGILAEVIKQRSELNPNAEQFDLEQLDANKENEKILAELGFENKGPQEIVAVFEQLENKQEDKVKVNENLVNGALNQATDKLDEAAKNQEEAKNLVSRANAAPGKEQKFELLSQAQDKIEHATELKTEARELLAFSDSVTKQGTADKDLLASIEAVTSEIKKDVIAENISDLKEVITGNIRTINAVREGDFTNPVDVLVDEKTDVQKEKKAWSDQRDGYLKTEKQLEQEIAQLKADLPNAKNKDIPGIESAINSKTSELAMVVEVREGLETKIATATRKEKALDERIAFLQDVTSVNGGRPVSPAEVQNKLTAVDSKNNNTLAAYIDQQVTDLKKEPAIQAIADNQSAGTEDPVVEQLNEDYEEKVKAVNERLGTNPREKEEALLALDRGLDQQVDEELTKVEETLASNPNDEKAIKRREELKGLQEKLEDQISERETKIAGLSDNPAITITPETELTALAPNHDEQLEAISESTPKGTLEKQNDLDKALIGKIDQEIRKVEQQQQGNPNDPQLKERKTALAQLKTDAEERIQGRETTIARLNSNPATIITPETELTALAPNHDAQLEAINESTPKGTLEKQNDLDETLIGKIDQEIRKVEQQQQVNPNDPQLNERKAALTTLKTETEERIKDRESMIASLGGSPATTITAETVLATLAPNHEAQLEAINESTPKGTLEKQNVLDKALIRKIDQEIGAIEQLRQQNPNDPNLRERKTALAQLKTDTEERIQDRETTIANLDSNPATTITAETELAALAPNHDAQLEAINESTPKATLEKQNKLEETLIGKIDQEIRKVEQQQEVNPNDPQLKERKDALTELKSDAEERIRDRNTQIANLDGNPVATISPETELAAIAPNHEAELEAVNESTPKGTLEAQNALDQQLVNQINSELEDVEGQLLRNPDNEQAKARETALNALKDQVEERISGRTEELVALENNSIPETNPLASVAAELRPDYAKNIAAIDAKMEDGTAKELALLKEEQGLLDAIDKAISQKEVELQKNPSNTQLLNEIDDLKAVQIIQEAKVSEDEEELIALEKAKIEPEQLITQIDPKYRAPDAANRDAYSEEEIARFTQQEKELQDKLIKRLNSNIKKLEKGFDPKLAAENKIITGLMERSVNLQQTLNEPVVEDPAVADRIAEELGQDHEFVMLTKPASIDDAKRILTELHEYENVLTEQIETLKGTDPVDEEAVKAKSDQLKSVRKRIGVVEADLDEMESFTELASNPNDSEAQKELTQLTAAESEIQGRLNQGNLTAQQQRAAEKELAAVQAKKAVQETIVLQEDVEETKAKRLAATNELNQSAGAGDPLAEAVKQRSADLTEPTAAKPTKREVEQQLLQEEQATVLVATTNDYLADKKLYDAEKLVTATPEELKTQRRRFAIEIGQLEGVIAAGKDDPKRAEDVKAAQTQLTALEAAVATIDEMLAKLDEEKIAESPVKEGLQSTVTYEDEVKVASSPGYPALLQQYTETQGTKVELEAVVREKERVRAQLATATPEESQPLIDQLRDLSAKETALRSALGEQESALETAVNVTENPEQVRNLLAREVAPVKQAPAAASVIAATLGDGFELIAAPAAVRTEKVLPVGTKAPSGLVYRVQVGAFAKPIPEDLFKEFTPVTGEKLNNGITRYLAGYFGNRNKVADAQREIRALGYSDAFVVAYCDGERITLAEARRLEDLGLCIPKNQDSLLMEIAQNTLAQLPADSLARLQPQIKPSDYNKAPGAALAEAAEEHKGLYFTVQVGVYNRPVPASQVKNIDPLVTKRLDNGQIRYSSGMFHSVDEARPKRAEAIERGITDAFITAYYQGERITIEEAKRLLAEQGNTVLEPKTTIIPANALELAKEYSASQPTVKPDAEPKVQFVSKEQYDEYPRAEISRLNNYGSFYYDPSDKRIKSVEYLNSEVMAQLETLQQEMDTVQTVQNVVPFELKRSTIVAEWESLEMTGAAADWLLRITQPHSGKVTETGFVLSFENVPAAEQEALIQTLQKYGAGKVELETEKQL
jgi:epidermal growth factor receptor substrate 15